MKSLALILLGLLFFSGGCDRSVKHGVEFVIAVGTNQLAPVSSKELQNVVTALAKRVDKIGYRSEVRAAGENRISVKLPFHVVENMGQRRTLFTKGGVFELRFVHAQSAQLLADGMVPAGYRVMNETRVMPSGQPQNFPFLVSKERVVGVSGANITRAAYMRGNMNDPRIAFEFDASGKEAFAQVTTANVGRQLAILLDGEVYSAPMIRTPITEGRGEISGGNITEAEAREMAVLMEVPLPVPTRMVEERTF
jgi:protein-export membrane protein SecD